MQLDLTFPRIKDAHELWKSRNFLTALEIYTDTLEEIDQESEEYALVLLEYSQCLIESIMERSVSNYKRILQTKSVEPDDDLEEDLENAWDCFETCRLYFENLSNTAKLSEVFKGLGDVFCLKNSFDEGRAEYESALSYSTDEKFSVCILECIADCYMNTEMYTEAISTYMKLAELYNKLGMCEKVQEMNGLIEGVQIMKERHAGDADTSEDSKQVFDDSEPKNINHLKR